MRCCFLFSTVFIIASAVVATPARAEQFLGVDPESVPADGIVPAPANPQASAPDGNVAGEVAAPVVPAVPWYKQVGVRLDLGSNTSRRYSVTGALRYIPNRWVTWEFGGFMDRVEDDPLRATEYGPFFGAITGWKNKTIAFPYLRGQFGWQRWHRDYNDERYADGASATALAGMGLVLKLSKFLGLRIERVQKTYLEEPPLGLELRDTKEKYVQRETVVGFTATF